MQDKIICGNALEALRGLPDQSVNCCVTSPPYWGLRDYGVGGQLGLEKTPEEYVGKLVEVFREVRRVLRDDGTLWLNLGDSYAGSQQQGGDGSKSTLTKGEKPHAAYPGTLHTHKKAIPGLKPKDLVGIPWRVAFALQSDGWWLRSDIIWAKPNPMPESVRDRPTKSHEYIFLLAKSRKYYYDQKAIREANSPTSKTGGVYRHPWKYAAIKDVRKSVNRTGVPIPRNGRNKRDVWRVSTKPFKGAHFAVFPADLIRPLHPRGMPGRGRCP